MSEIASKQGFMNRPDHHYPVMKRTYLFPYNALVIFADGRLAELDENNNGQEDTGKSEYCYGFTRNISQPAGDQ